MMRKTLRTLILSGFLIACEMDKAPMMEGILIYSGGGRNIMTLDLGNPEIAPKVLYESSVPVSVISYLSKVDSTTIIFDECQVTKGCSLMRLNFKTGHAELLLNGQFPSYIPERSILFFCDMHNSDRWLFSTNMGNFDLKKQIAIVPDKLVLQNGVQRTLPSQAISISSDEVVLLGPDNTLISYRLSEDRFVITSFKEIIPILFRSKTGQLLVEEYETERIFLLSLDDSTKEELPALKGGYGYLYLPEYDALLFGKAGYRFPFGERYDLFLYYFGQEQVKKVFSNVHVGNGIYFQK
jgi:hypothetical protein